MERSGKQKPLTHCEFPVHNVSQSPSSSSGKRNNTKPFRSSPRWRAGFDSCMEAAFSSCLVYRFTNRRFSFCLCGVGAQYLFAVKESRHTFWHKFLGGWLLTLPSLCLNFFFLLTQMIDHRSNPARERGKLFMLERASIFLMPWRGEFSQGTQFVGILGEALLRGVGKETHSFHPLGDIKGYDPRDPFLSPREMLQCSWHPNIKKKKHTFMIARVSEVNTA